MRATNYYIALSALALAAVGCSDSTGLADCSYPSTTASFAPSGDNFTGVVTSIRYSSGRSPEGGIASQVDVILTPLAPAGTFPPGTKLHMVLGSTTPVFAQHGTGTPANSSACELARGQKVNVWIPLGAIFGSGFGDFPNDSVGSLESITFEPNQVEILGS
jgi:hypothetical protein